MTDDLIAFVTEMDRCWLERRFGDLAAYLADDVVIVANDGKHRVRGREAAVESYREFMSRSVVDRFQASDYIVTEHGSAAVVEYRWDMAWGGPRTKHEAAGREILVLSRSEDGWRVIWRMQSAS
jgi:ketosteroid isomerase-like protein